MIFLFAFVFFLGCSKDEKPQEEKLSITVENLLGTWVTIESKEIVTANDSSVFQPIEAEDKYSYQFNSNLTVIAKDIFSNTSHEGTFVMSDNAVKLNFENEEETLFLYIRSFTENELIIYRSNGFEGIVIKFKKQEK